MDNPDGAAFPHCVIGSLNSWCGLCKSDVQASCTATEALRVCATNADCAGDNGTACCTVDGYSACINTTIAGIAGFPCQDGGA
jgi:hypothetical protein